MGTEKIILISSIALPLITLVGVVLLTLVMRNRSLKNRDQLLAEKRKNEQKNNSNKLWQTLVNQKEKHISVLREKIKKERF